MKDQELRRALKGAGIIYGFETPDVTFNARTAVKDGINGMVVKDLKEKVALLESKLDHLVQVIDSMHKLLDIEYLPPETQVTLKQGDREVKVGG